MFVICLLLNVEYHILALICFEILTPAFPSKFEQRDSCQPDLTCNMNIFTVRESHSKGMQFIHYNVVNKLVIQLLGTRRVVQN